MCPAKYTPEERIEAFWSKIDKSGGGDACWIWTRCRTTSGYGHTRWEYQGQYRNCTASRIAYELVCGAIPEGLQVLHKCDNRACCNPSHLFLGTNYDNVMDRKQKGRGGDFKNEKHPMHKLTNAEVIEIRRKYAQGTVTQKVLANEYGVCRSTISHITTLRNRKLPN